MLVVLMATVVGLLPARHANAAPTISRVGGADRYATSAGVSASRFSPGVPVAYVASGESFPDALAAGAAATIRGGPITGSAPQGGPVLLTQRDALPIPIASELTRLTPARIIVVGGPAAVSDTVVAALDAYTPGPVTRLAGADRYETAVAVSMDAWPGAFPFTVHVATGASYPDALAAAAAAGKSRGPLLLVHPDGIPPVVAAELQRLDPLQIVIVGGTSAVSSAIEAGLQPLATTVVRRAGPDRYETAVAVSVGAFGPGGVRAYVATGESFPDALSAGAAAGADAAPVLLTQRTCMPASVDDELTRLDPPAIVVLGGTAAVSEAAAARTRCSAGLPSTG